MSLHKEYNNVPMAPSAVVMALWGPSRLNYILTNVVFWVIPSLSCVMFLLIGVIYGRWWQAAWTAGAMICLMLTPIPWTVTLLGFEDVGGLICVCIATYLFIRTEVQSRDVRRWMKMGAVLALLAVFRRWYLFLVIGLLLLVSAEATLYAMLSWFRSRTLFWRSMSSSISGPVISLATFAGAYGLVTFPLSVRRLRISYSYQYAAYQHGDSAWTAILANLGVLVQYYGLGQIILCLGCFVAALASPATRRTVLYLFVPACLAVVFFSRIQTLDPHQTLLVYLGLVVTPLVFSKNLLVSGSHLERKCGWIVLAVAVLLAGLSFQATFSSLSFPSSKLAAFLPKIRILPKRRNDLQEIENLFRFIERKAPVESSQHSVYVIASSWEFNSSLLEGAEYSLHQSLPVTQYISNTHDVDRRDGFPEELETASLVLVAVPLQTHLVHEQKVITVPYRLFLTGQGFAQAFVKDPESFNLDEAIRVYAYDRARPSTAEEIANLHELMEIPPDK
jgi:hypothetical protein